MKFNTLLAAAVTALLVAASPAHSQASVWQNSYQLEAAGKYSEAMAVLDAVAANSRAAELKLIRRGWLFYLLGSHNDAIREYRLALERNSQSMDARLGVTLPLMAQKRWKEAEQSARYALELAPNHYTALLRLTMAQEGQRDWAGMAKSAQSLAALYPTDATACVYLARSQAWLNHRDEALAAYEAVLVRYPGHLEAKAYIDKP